MPLTREPPSPKATISLRSLRLFLPDLQNLVIFLTERCDGPVLLKAGDATAAQVEDLRDASKRELRQVAVFTERPFLGIRLYWSGAHITLSGSDADASALARDVKSLLESHHAAIPPLRNIVREVWWSIFLVVLMGFFIVSQWDDALRNGKILLGILGGFTVLPVGILFWYLYGRGSAVVVAATRSEWEAATRRSRIQWAIGLIVAIIAFGGAIIGAIIERG